MAGWVGLVGWLIADTLPTKWSNSHPSVSQVTSVTCASSFNMAPNYLWGLTLPRETRHAHSNYSSQLLSWVKSRQTDQHAQRNIRWLRQNNNNKAKQKSDYLVYLLYEIITQKSLKFNTKIIQGTPKMKANLITTSHLSPNSEPILNYTVLTVRQTLITTPKRLKTEILLTAGLDSFNLVNWPEQIRKGQQRT